MAEQVDATDLKSVFLLEVLVRFQSRAPSRKMMQKGINIFFIVALLALAYHGIQLNSWVVEHRDQIEAIQSHSEMHMEELEARFESIELQFDCLDFTDEDRSAHLNDHMTYSPDVPFEPHVCDQIQ